MNILKQTGFLILLAALGAQHPRSHVRAEDPMNPCIDPLVLKLTQTDGIIMVYYHDGSWTGMIEGYDGWVSFDGERWFKSDHPYVPKCEPEAGGEGEGPEPEEGEERVVASPMNAPIDDELETTFLALLDDGYSMEEAEDYLESMWFSDASSQIHFEDRTSSDPDINDFLARKAR